MNNNVEFNYEFQKKSGSVLGSLSSKGTVTITDTKSEDPIFKLNFLPSERQFLLNEFRKAKRKTRIVADGPLGEVALQFKSNTPKAGSVIASASLNSGNVNAVLATQDDEEPDTQAMEPTTALVIIVGIIVVGYLGDRAIDAGASIDVKFGEDGVTLSIDGGSNPELPDGGGDGGGNDGGDNGGGDGGNNGGGDTPNPGDNSPPPD